MVDKDIHGIEQFLNDYPGMSIAPCRGGDLKLKGRFDFRAIVKDQPEIEDGYLLEISLPNRFPQAIPKVKETGRKIPKDEKYHVNNDESLCLGSPIRLLMQIHEKPDLTGFAENCLVPYLYAVSLKLREGNGFLFGELAHGDEGIIEDYSVLFELKESSQIIEALRLLGMKKRIANKQPCPCGCGKRLGACRFNDKLSKFRKIASLSWFRAHSQRNWTRL